MGAEFITEKIEAKNSIEVKKRHDALVKQAQYDNGHSGYTGSFAESPGVTVASFEALTEDDAVEYIDKTCQKWENAIAVRIKDTDNWIIGGCFSA